MLYRKITSYIEDYLKSDNDKILSGISLSVNAISNPHFPLSESLQKNLLKLYLNDVDWHTLS